MRQIINAQSLPPMAYFLKVPQLPANSSPNWKLSIHVLEPRRVYFSLSIQSFIEIHHSSATNTVLTHYMKTVSSLQNILHSIYYYFLKNGSFSFKSELEYIVRHDKETLMAGALRDLVLLLQHLRSRVE